MKYFCLLGIVTVLLQPGASSASADSAKLLEDPMKPPALALRKMRAAKASKNPQPAKQVAVKPPSSPLVLQSIIFSADRQVAIINDSPLVSGDKVEGARVVSIKKDRVTLVRQGRKLVLMLDSDSQAINKTRPKSEL